MIKIITKFDMIKKMLENDSDLRYIELPFKRYETVIASENGLSAEVKDIITTIEECKLDSSGNLISKFTHSPVGLDKLSDGSKTVIYVYYRAKLKPKNEIINIADCGPNAIEYLLRNYSNAELILYLNHYEFPLDVKCVFELNGVILNNTDEIFGEASFNMSAF